MSLIIRDILNNQLQYASYLLMDCYICLQKSHPLTGKYIYPSAGWRVLRGRIKYLKVLVQTKEVLTTSGLPVFKKNFAVNNDINYQDVMLYIYILKCFAFTLRRQYYLLVQYLKYFTDLSNMI